MAVWTVDQLLADMKRKANLPPGTNTKFSDPQILRIAYEALIAQVDPILVTLHEEYDVVREDVTITANDGTYMLPERAVSGTLRQVLALDVSGKPYPLARISPSDAWQYEVGTSSNPGYYSLEGTILRILPVPTTSGLKIRYVYRRRPSDLVLTTACGQVTTVGATTLTAPGGSFGSPVVVDVVRAKPPVGVIVQQQSATYGANIFTFGAGVLTDAGVSVGDYVCAYDTSCVVPLPERFHMLFTDLATAQLLDEWRYGDAAAALYAKVDGYVAKMLAAQSNRVSAQPQVCVGTSHLRGAGSFGVRRFGG